MSSAANGEFSGHIGATMAQSTPTRRRQVSPPPGAPNVVVIVLDDVGFSDLGCYGGEIPTPAMDALAATGLRYTNFRTTSVCSATRASLYTGLNPHSAGIGWLTFSDDGYPGYRGDLAPDAVTLAEALGASGYAAYHCGKWHVNADASITSVGPMSNWPLQRGYDRAYWFQGHSTDYFRPSTLFDGNQRVEIERGDYYVTDDLTDKAIAYVHQHVAEADGDPFFLTLAYSAAHSPLHARREDIEAQRGRYDRGWDNARDERLARQIAMGITPPNTHLPPRNPGVVAWDTLPEAQRRLYSRYMEVYAAVIARVDYNIGRFAASLRTAGLLDNTLLVLISDNGGSPDGGLTGTPNLLATLSGGVPLNEATALIDSLGSADTYPMYPAGWAMASNTPFRLYKHFTHLGGVADPLIVYWPRRIAAQGQIRPQYVHVCDIFPTILGCVGASALLRRNDAPTKTIQGKSFASTFASATAPATRREQHFEMNGTRAYYADGWRLVSKGVFGQPGDGWELYDLRSDCNETHDLAATNPEMVSRLERKWTQAAQRYDVFPIDTRSLREKSLAPIIRGGGRTRWKLIPPVEFVPEEAAPSLIGFSHTIDFELNAPLNALDRGVLLALGNRHLGYVIYIQDGKLVHELVCGERKIRTASAVAPGAKNLGLIHRLSARPWRGAFTLTAENRTLLTQSFDAVPFGKVMQGMEIGRNGALPVSSAYEAPFPFSGSIANVVITLDATPYSAEEIAAIGRGAAPFGSG
jgi:arylsulfatase